MAYKALVRLGLLALACILVSSPSLADTVSVNTYSQLLSAINGAPAGGRTIVMAAGTYTQGGSLWIYDKANLTIQGATGNPADVVIVGLGINNSNQHHNIAIDTCPNFTIEAVTLKNSYYHAIQVNDASHNCVIRNCILWDNGESGVKATHGYNNPSARYSDYGLVENCRIGFTTQGVRSVVEGVDLIATKGWIIRNNVFVNVTKGGGSVAYGCFPKGNAQDSIIENNYFYNCDIAASFGGGGTGTAYFRDGITTYEHRNGVIRNNIMVGGMDAAVYLNKSLNAKVYNNLAYAHGLTFQGRFSQTSATFRNNVAVNCGDSVVVRWRDSAVDLGSSHNVFGQATWFVAPADSETADFHLRVTATAAIDQGYSLQTDVPTDKDGVARPQGGAFDLGPYEYAVPVNHAPTVNAGADKQAVEGTAVSLAASASDPDNDTLAYTWVQTAGKSVTLSGANTATCGFAAPVVATRTEASLLFWVTVNDGHGEMAYDSVSVRVYLAGDVDRDDAVNVFDIFAIAESWNTATGDPAFNADADLDGDGAINVFDIFVIAENWNRVLN